MSERTERAKEILDSFNHPEINLSLVKLGMIGSIKDENDGVVVSLKLPFPNVPIKSDLIELIISHLKDEEISAIVDIEVMTNYERMKFMDLSKKNWAL